MLYHVTAQDGQRVTRNPIALWAAERIQQDARQQWGYRYEVRPAVAIVPPKSWESQVYVETARGGRYVPAIGLDGVAA
jgi:hypothetical protein